MIKIWPFKKKDIRRVHYYLYEKHSHIKRKIEFHNHRSNIISICAYCGSKDFEYETKVFGNGFTVYTCPRCGGSK